ncbi:enoyl-CoA hydratase-related protein [Pseudactinotalea suaedae]|uniref:enoyl-CoA hydratase-related protein n=1 Tax=Pseudactinotalea suaedae TaxID=1524924 RepID=UPI0012E133B1|nr:enoyl-CoA hydratase-related protein [Pseudactinotalea suaedae]
MTGSVLVERADDVVTVTFANPRRRNALDHAMYDAFEATCDDVRDDRSVRAVVLRGAEGHFAGGTDINELLAITDGDLGVEYERRMRQVQSALLAVRVPVLAVVDGACVGGGLVLAALADIVYATSRARFGSPIAQTIGNTLSATSIARLHATLGRRLTSEILLTGRLLDAAEARAAGFVTAVADGQELETLVATALDRIRTAAPLTLRSVKGLERRIDAAVSQVPVDDVYRDVYGSEDFRTGVASFVERRPPRFTGR